MVGSPKYRDLGRSNLPSSVNQPVFGTVISTIEHLAKDVTDLPTAKLSFSVLIRMVLTWGGPDFVYENGNTPNGLGSSRLEGFDQFMMTRFSPLCWALPSNPTFDTKDAQGKQALNEAAALQKAIYAKTGQDYLTYLRDMELRGMGMDEQTIGEYLGALVSGPDARSFQGYFKVGRKLISDILDRLLTYVQGLVQRTAR